MRHDYDLPPTWASMSAAERDRWFKQERAWRQAMNQETPFRRHVERLQRRRDRRDSYRGDGPFE